MISPVTDTITLGSITNRLSAGLRLHSILLCAIIVALLVGVAPTPCFPDAGLKPEDVYRPYVPWKLLVDTWEALPPLDPLAEKPYLKSKGSRRTLLTLRKDGTCRVFNADYPTGSDGIWTFERHKMRIRFPGGSTLEYYVYGVKGDYMLTRSAKGSDSDQLWTRVK